MSIHREMEKENVVYIYIMQYYSAIKRHAIGSFVKMCMDLESVIQGEVSQKEKNSCHILGMHAESTEMVQMILVPGQE